MTLLHILRVPPTTTAQEKAQLAELDKYQRRYLSRRMCALCDHSLDQPGCGACMGPACPEEVRIERRMRCLAAYRPRPNRRRGAR